MRFEAYTVMDELYDVFELRKQAGGRNLFLDMAPATVPERLEIPKRFLKLVPDDRKAEYRKLLEAYKARRKFNADEKQRVKEKK